MEKMYFDLLRDFCDALISLQFKNTDDKTLDGGFYCRSCKMIHGRSPDAVYPFVVMAKYTGEKKYLDAARKVFDWGENMLCDNGAMYNDAQSTWQAITVFNAISLCEALESGEKVLDSEFKEKIEERLDRMGEWLYRELDEHFSANINYPVTNAYALALLGKYFGRDDYIAQGKHLADYAMQHISENGFLIGEGKPRNATTPLGCRPIDIGYNMEESIPSLVKYAYLMADEEMLRKLSDVLLKQLDFMLPDGAWDNSFSTRNNKWTYWGSRTSDGCASAYTLLSDRHPAFSEAARRNTELVIACTHGGLLYGGPHYYQHGEHPCTHHTFEHANAIAFALENSDKMTGERTALPSDSPSQLKFYPEVNTYKLSVGDYRATVTGYDFAVNPGTHAGGGTLTMLWKYGVGPMIAASVTDYVMVEIHNMQLPSRIAEHRPLTPRLEVTLDKKVYSTPYFTSPKMSAEESNDNVFVTSSAALYSKDGERLCGDLDRRLSYKLCENGLTLTAENAFGASLILPLIAGDAEIVSGKLEKKQSIFFLTGGFCAEEYTVTPDKDGKIEIIIK